MKQKNAQRTDKDFIADLRQELMATQEARLKLTLRKLVFVTGLLAIGGSLTFEESPIEPEMNPILLAPIIAILFDLYIEGENFGIRRIGNFIKKLPSTPNSEILWEELLNKKRRKAKWYSFWKHIHRDIFSSLANPFATVVVSGISILYVILEHKPNTYFIWAYISIIVILFVFWIIFKSVIMNCKLKRFKYDLIKKLRNKACLIF